jgi:cysteine desulfurase family protein
MRATVYLDYASTSGLRPERVVEAVAGYLRDVGATPGRSGHRLAVEAGRVALRCRRALAALLGIPGDPGRIAFQLNATHALNTALHGVLRPGDAVVRTRYDHNAVRRPVAALARVGVEERVLGGDAEGGYDRGELERLLRGGRPARLLVLSHASNVLGSVLPVREMAERARAAGALVLVDAAQSAGHLPLDAEELGVDLLAFSGHKGLLGPQGVGCLWVREGVEVDPLLRGGTGGDSHPAAMPAAYPDHLEAGTQNGPGIAGLLAGVEWLLERGVGALHRREAELKERLLRRLAGAPGLRVRSPVAPDGVGIVTVTADRLRADEVAHALEREHGVLARAGLHCAPEAHELLGTLESGAVRLSIGWATTEEDIDRAAEALRALTGRGTDG